MNNQIKTEKIIIKVSINCTDYLSLLFCPQKITLDVFPNFKISFHKMIAHAKRETMLLNLKLIMMTNLTQFGTLVKAKML